MHVGKNHFLDLYFLKIEHLTKKWINSVPEEILLVSQLKLYGNQTIF